MEDREETKEKSQEKAGDPIKCKIHLAVEGWVIFITGIHPQTEQDDIYEPFAEFGRIRNLHLNLDRKTGFTKGYAIIDYQRKSEAKRAISAMNGQFILGKKIAVDFAFRKPVTRDEDLENN